MAETLLKYQHPVVAEDGTVYEARACGGPMTGGRWQGWIEFVPAMGEPVRTPRETTQPNRVDTEYWATGISAVYLEGALRRALSPVTIAPPPVAPPPPIFSGPAPTAAGPVESGQASVLNPFSAYEKGEPLLRKQLGALSTWHLVNIILAYELSDQGVAVLNNLQQGSLIDIIVAGVRNERDGSVRQR